jgi:hypothetical protein
MEILKFSLVELNFCRQMGRTGSQVAATQGQVPAGAGIEELALSTGWIQHRPQRLAGSTTHAVRQDPGADVPPDSGFGGGCNAIKTVLINAFEIKFHGI